MATLGAFAEFSSAAWKTALMQSSHCFIRSARLSIFRLTIFASTASTPRATSALAKVSPPAMAPAMSPPLTAPATAGAASPPDATMTQPVTTSVPAAAALVAPATALTDP
eukprot:CAMPEP_0172895506 /NCGR_PEP_ID=MMETSP1075-20121228/153250_1 /TAXON_ID=2916 /ORGANISM="Ceratium fusus, Strain PA161109" /LENGTH=109 /DNA_ID=CAMNT_0013750727 /DNA_START=625 /DNA_END=954 /DNA_ORIENTATION=-